MVIAPEPGHENEAPGAHAVPLVLAGYDCRGALAQISGISISQVSF